MYTNILKTKHKLTGIFQEKKHRQLINVGDPETFRVVGPRLRLRLNPCDGESWDGFAFLASHLGYKQQKKLVLRKSQMCTFMYICM